MNITIKINCDNAAFADYPEIEATRILRALADRIELNALEMSDGLPLMDINGNRVGRVEVTD